jgi:hypothetical protein
MNEIWKPIVNFENYEISNLGNVRSIERIVITKNKYWVFGQGDSTCPDCGGQMHWCSTCQMWSKSCCVDWGTCQCS